MKRLFEKKSKSKNRRDSDVRSERDPGSSLSSNVKATPKVFERDLRKVVQELVDLYPSMDFMKAVLSVSDKYNLNPFRVVSLFMDYTGSISLPDGYSLMDFYIPHSKGGEDEGEDEDEFGGYSSKKGRGRGGGMFGF